MYMLECLQLKRPTVLSVSEDVEQLKLLHTSVQNGTSTLESSLPLS